MPGDPDTERDPYEFHYYATLVKVVCGTKRGWFRGGHYDFPKKGKPDSDVYVCCECDECKAKKVTRKLCRDFDKHAGKSGSKWVESIKAVERASLNSKLKQQTLKKWIVRRCHALGESLLGHKLRVWWPKHQKYAEGIVTSFDPNTARHKLEYDQGKEEYLWLAIESYEDLGSAAESQPMPAVAQQSPSQPAAQPAMPASPDLLATEPVSTSAPAKGLHSPVPSELPQKRKIPEPARADSPVPTLLPVSPHFQSFKRLRRASDKSPPPQHASAAQQEREDLMATTVSDNEPQQAAQLAELQPVGSTGLEHIAAPAGYFQPSAAQHAEAQVEKQPRDSALQSIAKQVHRHQAAKQGQNSSLTATCRSAAQQPSTAISDIGQSQANAAAAGQSVSAVRQAVSAPMPAGQKNPSQASISQMATGSSAPAAGGLGTPTSSAVQRSKFLIASKSKSRLSQEGHARPPVSPHAHAPAKRPDIAADQPSDLALGGSAPLGTQAPPTQSNPAAQKPVPYPPGHPQTHDGVDAHAEAPETAQARPKYQKVTARKSAVAYQRRQLASAAAQAAPVLHSRKQLTGLAAQAAPVLHQRFKQVARLAQAPPVLLPRKQLTTYAAQAPHVVHPRKQLTSLAAQAAPVPHPRTQLASSADQSGLPMQHASNAQPSSAQSVSASRGLASLQATPQAASGASQPAEEDATEGSASDAKEIHSVEALGLQQSNAAQLPRELQGHGPAAFEQTGAANTSPHRHFGDAEVSAAQTSSQDKASAVLSADTNRLPHAAKDPSADALMRQQSVAADGSHAGVMQNISPDGQQHATQASHAADPERQQHGTLDSAAMQQSSADARKPTVHQDSAAADPLRQTATDAVQLVGLGTAAAAPQNTIAEVLQMQQSVAAGLHNTQPSAPAQWQTGKAAPQNATAEVLKMRQSVAAEPPKVQPIALSGWQTGQAANAGGPLATQHAGASSGVAAAQSHSRDKQTANQEASRGRLDAAASESGNVVKQDPSHTADSGPASDSAAAVKRARRSLERSLEDWEALFSPAIVERLSHQEMFERLKQLAGLLIKQNLSFLTTLITKCNPRKSGTAEITRQLFEDCSEVLDALSSTDDYDLDQMKTSVATMFSSVLDLPML